MDYLHVMQQIAALSKYHVTNIARVEFSAAVGSRVSRQFFGCDKCLTALVTLVRFIPDVGSPVTCQMSALSEGLVANVARERSVRGVCSRVSRRVAGRGKGLVTHVALVFFPGVNFPVSHQMRALGKGLVANVARERSFVCANSCVNILVTGRGKAQLVRVFLDVISQVIRRLNALNKGHVTNVVRVDFLPGVDSRVSFQVTRSGIGLVARDAAVRLYEDVRLLAPRQIRTHSKGLVTNAACERVYAGV